MEDCQNLLNLIRASQHRETVALEQLITKLYRF